MDGGTKSSQPEKDPTGPIDKQLPPDIRSVGLTLQAVLVEHTPRMGYGTDQQERNTKAVEAVGRQHPSPMPKTSAPTPEVSSANRRRLGLATITRAFHDGGHGRDA